MEGRDASARPAKLKMGAPSVDKEGKTFLASQVAGKGGKKSVNLQRL